MAGVPVDARRGASLVTAPRTLPALRAAVARVLLARPWYRRAGDAWRPDPRVSYRAVEAANRDAREMRGDPPDMAGWLLW